MKLKTLKDLKREWEYDAGLDAVVPFKDGEPIEKTEFEILKQILIDLGNINQTLGLMNLRKFFPSKIVNESIHKFYKDRKDFIFKEQEK